MGGCWGWGGEEQEALGPSFLGNLSSTCIGTLGKENTGVTGGEVTWIEPIVKAGGPERP